MPTYSSRSPVDPKIINALVELAQRDLPSVADLGVVAMLSGDADIVRSMLERVYEEALAEDRGYLAELADRALGSIEQGTRATG